MREKPEAETPDSAFALPIPPGCLTAVPSLAYGTLRYRACAPKASAHGLSPGTSSAQKPLFRPVIWYSFFKGWLLKPTSWLFWDFHILSHLAMNWGP